MVTWWLGAQWFGILGIPLMNGIVNERGTRVESQTPQTPNPKPRSYLFCWWKLIQCNKWTPKTNIEPENRPEEEILKLETLMFKFHDTFQGGTFIDFRLIRMKIVGYRMIHLMYSRYMSLKKNICVILTCLSVMVLLNGIPKAQASLGRYYNCSRC